MVELERDDKGIDIHHIFPRKWCEEKQISPRIFNSIINKTAISYKANRKIGGNAPSVYIAQLENDPAVQLASSDMDAILATHSIDAGLLRSDDFEGFFKERRIALLNLIVRAMGKEAVNTQEATAEDDADPYDDIEE